MSEAPKPARQKQRVIVCTGEYCNLGRRGEKIYRALEPVVAELNGGAAPPCIKLERANCLSLCGDGPNLVFYPADEHFGDMDEEAAVEIVRHRLKPCPPEG